MRADFISSCSGQTEKQWQSELRPICVAASHFRAGVMAEEDIPQLNEATLKAIIEGVAAKLQESSGSGGGETSAANPAGGKFFSNVNPLHPAGVKS